MSWIFILTFYLAHQSVILRIGNSYKRSEPRRVISHKSFFEFITRLLTSQQKSDLWIEMAKKSTYFQTFSNSLLQLF